MPIIRKKTRINLSTSILKHAIPFRKFLGDHFRVNVKNIGDHSGVDFGLIFRGRDNFGARAVDQSFKIVLPCIFQTKFMEFLCKL